MSEHSLQSAISHVAEQALSRVSDRILRLEVSKDWPISEALVDLHERTPLRVLVRRPFKASDFKGLKVTENAGVATGWRNDKGRKYAVLLLGTETGNLDAGLKDVRPLPRRQVVEEWRQRVIKKIGARGDLAKFEVHNLLAALFNGVANGEIPASRLETYVGVLDKTPTVKSVSNNLWRLGLIPDAQALDRAMASVRLRRNRELASQLRESDDARIDERLYSASQRPETELSTVAKAAIAFRETGHIEHLKKIKLPILEDILRTTASTPTRSVNFFDLLDTHNEFPGPVKICLEELREQWDLDEVPSIVPFFLEADLVRGEEKERVRLKLTPSLKEEPDEDDAPAFDCRWTGNEELSGILAAQSNMAEAEALNPNQVSLSAAQFRERAPANVPVDEFLEARRVLRRYEPWLERDAFLLLLLHRDARDAIRKYIDAWARLAGEASQLDDEADFVETVQVLETVQGGDAAGVPGWVVLGPLHPFRLDPFLRIAERIVECVNNGSSVEKLGDAALWMMDRSYPAYPTIHRGRSTLHLISHRGLIIYNKNPGQYLPPVREANGLDRVLRSVDGYSPWLLDGMSILAIDPPEGGGVVRALESARQRRADSSLYVYHLTTGDETDTLDGFNGHLEYLPRVNNLRDAQSFPPVNLILRFAAESAGAGETAGAQWQATRGTHLALEISEVFQGGPFLATRTPQIKIDPRLGNVVVRNMQALFRRLIGGSPMLATIRPLLQTDDAEVLSRMAQGTDWIVFAAPGPLGLVSPRTINDTLRFVGRSTMGNYGLYVYAADGMFPVRRYFEDHFRHTPVATIPPELLVSKLVDKAQQAGQAVLFASLGKVPAQVAALVAVEIANEVVGPDDELFVLSLDDMGWTSAWLGEGLRADYLVVCVKQDGSVVFTILESKSESSGEQVPCDPNQKAYKEGLEQVQASLKSVREITTAAEPSLDEDLRFASLIEHLMAGVLTRVNQLDDARRQLVFDAVNGLSRRSIMPKFEGTVVLTQTGVNRPRETRRVDSLTQIIWAGAPEINRVLGLDDVVSQAEESAPTDVSADEVQSDSETAAPVAMTEPSSSSTQSLETALAFIAAARIHGIPILDDKPVYLQEGPSLIAVGIRLKEGTTIQPLRARLGDIARDVGLGDRANEMDVENNSEPRTVRVLLPRPDRRFPELPALPRIAVGPDGYLPLYLGQSVDGTDWAAAVEGWPHMLIAGTTGSGKTTFVRSILQQLQAYGAQNLQLVVVDGKGDTDYLGLLRPEMFPTRFPDVQLGHQSAVDVLTWAVDEMEDRRKRILEVARQAPSPQGVKATDLYRTALSEERVPEIKPLILVIDEFADIMLAGKKSAEKFEDLVQRISQVGRSRLTHLVLATQRPDKETIRGSIKANLNARCVFRLPTQADSMTVLGHAGAERLMLHGDMLFQHGTGTPRRLQAYKV